jgi:hypothetical protein
LLSLKSSPFPDIDNSFPKDDNTIPLNDNPLPRNGNALSPNDTAIAPAGARNSLMSALLLPAHSQISLF